MYVLLTVIAAQDYYYYCLCSHKLLIAPPRGPSMARNSAAAVLLWSSILPLPHESKLPPARCPDGSTATYRIYVTLETIRGELLLEEATSWKRILQHVRIWTYMLKLKERRLQKMKSDYTTRNE